jgi:hypothetical protein
VEFADSDDEQRKNSMNSHPDALIINPSTGHLDPYEMTIDVIHDKSNSSHNSLGSQKFDEPKFNKAISTLAEQLDANHDD